MSRFALFLFLVSALGCGTAKRSTDSTPGTSSSMTQATNVDLGDRPIEEFEGIVELFGRKLRARRQVTLDGDGNYVNHGQAVAWYETGQKAGEMAFRNGQPEGKQRLWHENGKKKLSGSWQNGQATGQWTEWYENGQMMSDGNFLAGQKNGPWRFWNDDGQLREEIQYDHGTRQPVVGRAKDSDFR